MKLSALGLAILEFCEEFRSIAYQDSGGVWTAGYGHTGEDVIQGTTCTLESAALWLAADVGHAESAVTIGVTIPLSQSQFDALVLFAYNVGVHAFADSTLLRLLNGHDAADAATQFLVWDRVRGLENEGLERRRRLEKALFLASQAPV